MRLPRGWLPAVPSAPYPGGSAASSAPSASVSPHAATAVDPIQMKSLPATVVLRTNPDSMHALPSTRSKTLFVTLTPVAFSIMTTADLSKVQSPPDGIECLFV